MKVTFLKHHNEYRKDGVHELPDGTANYLLRAGVVAEAGKDAKATPAPKKAADAPPAPKKEKRPVQDMEVGNTIKKEKPATKKDTTKD